MSQPRPPRSSRLVAALLTGALMALGAAPSQAEVFGGVDFPQGVSSFADAVVSFDPVIKNGQPTAPYLNPLQALGVPDYRGASCASAADCSFASLGDGGAITLRFIDNRLTGSGSSALDLWIFEVGPDVEDTFVEISKDGITYFSVGAVTGSTRGVDIDAFGFGINDRFAFVRLTDNGDLDGQSGATVGADIDAIGAISSVTATVPEPGTWALMAGGLLLLGAATRRRKAA
jgi:hypothetical protein